MKLTAVFKEDKECGGFACWFEEIPEAISQGDTLEEAKNNLLEALEVILAYRREEAEKCLISDGSNVSKQVIDFELPESA